MISVTPSGELSPPRETIFPIFRLDENNCYYLVGTGFFIANDGIFITAKHVIEEIVEHENDAYILHFYGDTYVMRKMAFFTLHEEADIAVAMLDRIQFKDSGLYLDNSWSAINLNKPNLGDNLSTYAYPKTMVRREDVQSIDVIPTVYEGEIVKVYPIQRDSLMIRSPCYQVEMGIAGGASGGPVFDESGKVVAINTSSVEGESVTFVSCIQAILDTSVYKNAHISNTFTPKVVREIINEM